MTRGAFLPVVALAASTAHAQDPCDVTVGTVGALTEALAGAQDGTTLCLRAGRYELTGPLEVDRAVTLRGPMAGFDPRPTAGTRRRPGDPTIEAILDGTASRLAEIVVVGASDVALEGLEVVGGTGDLVATTGEPLADVRLRHLIVHGAGDEGIQVRAVERAEIAFNYVFDTEGDAINLCCGAADGRVHHNEVRDIRSTNGALYLYEASNGATGWTEIADNIVRDVRVNDGIRLGARGGDVGRGGYRVLRNRVEQVAGDGITVYVSRTEVIGNDLRRAYSSHGAIHATYALDGLRIADNTIAIDGGRAVRIGDTRGGPSGVVIVGNCFDGEGVGVSSASTRGRVDARGNWWADPSGPSGAGAGIGVSVDGDVAFDPALDDRDGCAPDRDSDGDPDQRDCAPDEPTIHANAEETCDGVDEDCDGSVDELASGRVTLWRDVDGDGFGAGDDDIRACSDPQPGYAAMGADCDDADPDVGGPTLRAFPDADGDGYGQDGAETLLCAPEAGFVEVDGDCDDDDPSVHVGAAEVCDGADNDCDGGIDDKDGDEDGFIDVACGGDDCDDRDYRVNPGATEACFDGIDNDCDGAIDDASRACPQPDREGGCGCTTAGVGPRVGWLLPVVVLFAWRRRSPAAR